ncbi:MAG: hypothetical protein Q8O17_04270 [Candidatus Methanoperedens sp.]|nr:hypothetical protein [Candidatus Methanoperedens sp.]
MKNIPRYIASIPVQNPETEQMNISLGFDETGKIELYCGDTAELGQDSSYINKDSFPNSGLLACGKYSMWLSMFSRHITTSFEDYDE